MRRGAKRVVCLMICVILLLSVSSTAAAPDTRNIADSNAAYRYIAGEMGTKWEGEITFEDMTYILSKLFDISGDKLGLPTGTKVRAAEFLDILWNQCKVDTTLIERNYAAESAYLTYEQFFDALNHFYFEIIGKHGMTARPANLYQLSGESHLAFDDGKVLTTETVSLPDGRVTVTCLGDTVIEISPFETPYDLRFSAIRTMHTAKGILYYYSEEEKTVILKTRNGLERYDIIGNPTCFGVDGISRAQVNETMLDKTVTLYLTDHKKATDVVVMIRL